MVASLNAFSIGVINEIILETKIVHDNKMQFTNNGHWNIVLCCVGSLAFLFYFDGYKVFILAIWL